MSMIKGMARRWLNRLLLGFVAISVASCGGGGGGAGTPPFGGGGGGGTVPTLADLTVVLSAATVSNSGNEGVGITVTSLDANRVAIGNVPVVFAIDNGGVITPAATNTNASTGTLQATAGIGADRTNRTIKVTVSSGSITKVVSFDVVDSVTGGKVADLSMTTNRATVPNDGSAPMLVTVTTLDASRSALGGSPMTLSIADPVGSAFVSPGGAQTTSATTGQLVATVEVGANKTNRTLTLTASSGTVSRAISFDVVDPIVAAPVAADLAIVLSTGNIGNAGSEAVNVTVTAVDSRRNALAGIPVTFEVDANATVTVQNGLTDVNGEAKARVTIGADRSERVITVTARSDGLTPRTASFRVSGVSIQSTAVPALPAAGTNAQVEFRVTDVNQNPMAGIPITITPSVVADNEANGPVVKTGITSANGSYVYSYRAPNQSGLITFSALAAGRIKTQNVVVPDVATVVPPASLTPSAPNLTLTPSVVRVNTTPDSDNRTEIRAYFVTKQTGNPGADNVPIQNVRVRFDLVDPMSVGGTIATGSSIVYTDAQGVAVSSYRPGERASPTNGQTIRVCWSGTNFGATECPNSSFISLTVVADPLSITIGTDNLIQEGPTGLTYIKRFVLLVVDSAGNPKSDVQLTPAVDLEWYAKGYYQYDQLLNRWVKVVNIACQAEDVNRNGVIDGAEDDPNVAGGLGNGNGQLDPRKSDVSISMVGATRTDANGTAVMKIEYPKSFGSWVFAKLSVTAAGVLSPPAYESRWLDVSSAELLPEATPPSFVVSPYGVQQNCRNPS